MADGEQSSDQQGRYGVIKSYFLLTVIEFKHQYGVLSEMPVSLLTLFCWSVINQDSKQYILFPTCAACGLSCCLNTGIYMFSSLANPKHKVTVEGRQKNLIVSSIDSEQAFHLSLPVLPNLHSYLMRDAAGVLL